MNPFVAAHFWSSSLHQHWWVWSWYKHSPTCKHHNVQWVFLTLVHGLLLCLSRLTCVDWVIDSPKAMAPEYEGRSELFVPLAIVQKKEAKSWIENGIPISVTFQPYDYRFNFQKPDMRRIKWSQSWLPRYFYQHIYIPSIYCLVRLYNVLTE